jgi:hypothetical protein
MAAAAAAVDMLEVEGQLEAGAAAEAAGSDRGGLHAAVPSSSGADGFHSSSKGGTWKKFKRNFVAHKKTVSEQVCAWPHARVLHTQACDVTCSWPGSTPRRPTPPPLAEPLAQRRRALQQQRAAR